LTRHIPVLLFCCYAGAAFGQEVKSTCETSYALPKLSGSLQVAEASFAELDVAGFSNSIEETVLFVLPCLKDPIETVVAAQVHRMLALRAYSSRREDLIEPSMLAGRQLEPDYRWPEVLIPEGHEFREQYEALPAVPSGTRTLRSPKDGTVLIDGEATLDLVTERAAIVQYLDGEGQTQWTQYRMPSDDVRSYPVAPRTRNRLLLAGGAQLVVAGALLGGSAAATAAFYDESADRSLEEVDRLRAQANSLRSASLGVALSGGLCFGLSVALWDK
jgi:hypothetical protein